jgi:16S rRNA processing protein RimM
LSAERVQLGTVVRAHGVGGLVRVRGSAALAAMRRLFVGGRPFAVEALQRERGDFLVRLEGVGDRDAAEALRGAPVEVEREALPPPAADELYVADLIGCAVVDASGARLGEVAETFDSGAQEVLVVRGGAAEFMLPFVDGIVTAVDLEARRIVCDPPEGLIDLERAERG